MILITGAIGRVGKALISKLLEQKRYRGKIRVLVRNSRKATDAFGKKVKIYEADLTSEHDFAAIAEACRNVELIIHLAATLDYSLSEKEMMRTNYEGMLRLLKAAKLQKQLPRFIHLSSSSLYRGVRGITINEHTPPFPTNSYGRSKLKAESALKSSGLDYIILRPPIIYGAGFHTGFADVLKLIKKERMFIVGDGKNYLPHIHISDLLDAILLAMKSKLKKQEFVIASREHITQSQAYGMFAKVIGVRPPGIHIPLVVADAAAGVAHALYVLFGKKPKIFKEYIHTLAQNRIYDISKARRLLGFEPKVGLKPGIRNLVESFEVI